MSHLFRRWLGRTNSSDPTGLSWLSGRMMDSYYNRMVLQLHRNEWCKCTLSHHRK